MPWINGPHFELHINASPAFTEKFGARVKAAGGSYTHARGHSESRFVRLPIEAHALAAWICDEFPLRISKGRSVVVLRNTDCPTSRSEPVYDYRVGREGFFERLYVVARVRVARQRLWWADAQNRAEQERRDALPGRRARLLAELAEVEHEMMALGMLEHEQRRT